MRKSFKIQIGDVSGFVTRLLHWCSRFEHTCFLNSNTTTDTTLTATPNSYDLIVAADAVRVLTPNSADSFTELKNFYEVTKDWMFGHLSYDLKNQVENLSSLNIDKLAFPDISFFQPAYVFLLKGNELEILYLKQHKTEQEIKQLLQLIIDTNLLKPESQNSNLTIQSRVSKSEYISSVNSIKQHIRRGDIYEMNFCVEFFAAEAQINPEQTYLRLNEISQTPFSAFYKLGNKYMLSASPERFLKKSDNTLLSQPIKGTVRRGINSAEDEHLKKQLFLNEKERNENVMIVDIVRNDLARSATKGSVQVKELYGIYTFKQVHQMISSVSAQLKPDIHFIDAIKNAFPMGSMTGAPKVRAMELIEQYELVKRGLYSGAVGYITPEGNFDLNVVIRSILYNQSTNYLSFIAGSAITEKAEPEQEYEECLLKAKAFFDVLNNNSIIEAENLYSAHDFRV
ncbi:MAG: anthranilate synthase component I family protein [Bacteroidia bacterium]|nr:anthranilate synthase component I family protein [Bacteroidia bacterium]